MGCLFARVRCRRSHLDRGYERGNALLGAQRESTSLCEVNAYHFSVSSQALDGHRSRNERKC
ncbi:unnamed protein product, partial [Ectocarpus sp. 12 AP-2014]